MLIFFLHEMLKIHVHVMCTVSHMYMEDMFVAFLAHRHIEITMHTSHTQF